MTEKSVFISSCSRRQLARRRSGRGVWRLAVSPATLTVLVAALGFLAARGTF